MKMEPKALPYYEKRYAHEALIACEHDSISNISKHKVGACVVSKNDWGAEEFFVGGNIEIATTLGFHAEVVALIASLSAGYRNILQVFVTSSSKSKDPAAMCGSCRQYFMYANPDCEIIIVNKNKEELLRTTVKESLNYPYMGRGALNRKDSTDGINK